MNMAQSPIMTQDELLAGVKSHAAANYAKEGEGWDFLIETANDDEIRKAMGRSKKLPGAIWAVQTNLGLKLLAEARQEMQAA
jgi:hypothetical protein